MKARKVPFRFQKGNKFGKGGAREGAGQPSALHRAACRKLVEDLRIREFFGDITQGKKVDFTMTLAGKVVNVPASIRNRILAGITLIEQGHGKKTEVTHTLNPAQLEAFKTALLHIFQRRIPKTCPSCGTLIKLSPQIAQEIMALSQIFDTGQEVEA